MVTRLEHSVSMGRILRSLNVYAHADRVVRVGHSGDFCDSWLAAGSSKTWLAYPASGFATNAADRYSAATDPCDDGGLPCVGPSAILSTTPPERDIGASQTRIARMEARGRRARLQDSQCSAIA